jgi:hypothetical protein
MLLEASLMLLEASFMLLEASLMLLEAAFKTFIVPATVATIVNYVCNTCIIQTK